MSEWLEEKIPLEAPKYQHFEEPVLISSVSRNQKEIYGGFLSWPKCTLTMRVYVPPKDQGLRGGPTYRYLLAYRTHLSDGKDFNVFALRYYPPEKNQWGIWISNNKAERKDITISDELESGWHHFLIGWDHSKPELVFLIDRGKGGSNHSESYLSHWPEPQGNKAFVGSWIASPDPPSPDSYCETYLHQMAIYESFSDPQTPVAKGEVRPPPSSHLQTNENSGPPCASADVLLVTATKVEALAILNLVEKKFNRKYKAQYIGSQTCYDLGVIGGARTCMVRSEMSEGGPSGSTITVLESIDKLSPSAVIMVGIAFGVVPEKQAIGDILVSKQLMAYGLQRIGTRENGKPVIIDRGDRPSAPPQILDRFRDGELSWDGPKVEFGLILSGPKLVDNIDFREQLQELEPEAIGGEMEGGGLYSAAHRRKADWIVVKAICDWADGKKHENKGQRQEEAARNAASFTIHVIERGGFANNGSSPVQPPETTGKSAASQGGNINIGDNAQIGNVISQINWRTR